MERPLISFCLFAYNQEALVREAIEGAFAQTYSPMEIILSDDGSPDGTFDIMSEMAASYTGPHKIILNRNEHNLGIVPHVNKVLMELASGEIFVLAAGDDISYPYRVERIWQKFDEEGAELMLLGSLVETISENGMPLPEMDIIFNNLYSHRRAFTINDFAKGGREYAQSGATLAFRNDLIKKFGRLSELLYGEDWELCMRGLLSGYNALINDKLIKYRNSAVRYSTDIRDHFVIRDPKFYGFAQSSDTAALLSVMNYQRRTGEQENKALLKAKYILLKRIKRQLVIEELSKSFPKAGSGLYLRLWIYQPRIAIKFTLYKLGLLKLFIKYYSRRY